MDINQYRELWQRQIIADPEYTPAEFRIGVVRSWHFNRTSRIAWPGTNTIITLARVSRSTVIRTRKKFMAKGVLEIRSTCKPDGTQGSNRYVPRLKPANAVPKPECQSYDTPGYQSYDTRGCQSYDTLTSEEHLNERLPYGRSAVGVTSQSEDSTEIRKARKEEANSALRAGPAGARSQERKESGEEERVSPPSDDLLFALFREVRNKFGEKAISGVAKAVRNNMPLDEIRNEIETVHGYGGDYRELAYALWRP